MCLSMELCVIVAPVVGAERDYHGDHIQAFALCLSGLSYTCLDCHKDKELTQELCNLPNTCS